MRRGRRERRVLIANNKPERREWDDREAAKVGENWQRLRREIGLNVKERKEENREPKGGMGG